MASFFHKLLHPTGTKQWLTNPGGALVTKAMNNGKTYQGPIGAIASPAGPAEPNPGFDPGQRVGSTINGQSGVDQPAQRLGWTNGGYTYHNSPFNGQPVAPANPMSFAPPQNAGGAPQQMLPPPNGGGSMPPTGAPPPQSGTPTMHIPQNPQIMQAMMLRNQQGMGP